jgi:hypothetical protein
MNSAKVVGLNNTNAKKGAAMEAHAGTITIGTRKTRGTRRRRLAQLRGALRQRRLARAERAYSLRMNGVNARSIPGSEHTHLPRPKGF